MKILFLEQKTPRKKIVLSSFLISFEDGNEANSHNNCYLMDFYVKAHIQAIKQSFVNHKNISFLLPIAALLRSRHSAPISTMELVI